MNFNAFKSYVLREYGDGVHAAFSKRAAGVRSYKSAFAALDKALAPNVAPYGKTASPGMRPKLYRGKPPRLP